MKSLYTKAVAKKLLPFANSIESINEDCCRRSGAIQATYFVNGRKCSTFLSKKAFLEVNSSQRRQAAEVIEVVEFHGGGKFVVKSSNRDAFYCVRLSNSDPIERCDCGDCYFRGVECKHQIACKNYLINMAAA
jgi:hypothetical protein